MKTISKFQKSPEENTLSNPVVNNQATDLINGKMEKQSTPCPMPQALCPVLPTFPDSVFEALPPFIQKVVDRSDSKEDRDMMLLGSMVTCGSCLTNVYGLSLI